MHVDAPDENVRALGGWVTGSRSAEQWLWAGGKLSVLG